MDLFLYYYFNDVSLRSCTRSNKISSWSFIYYWRYV